MDKSKGRELSRCAEPPLHTILGWDTLSQHGRFRHFGATPLYIHVTLLAHRLGYTYIQPPVTQPSSTVVWPSRPWIAWCAIYMFGGYNVAYSNHSRLANTMVPLQYTSHQRRFIQCKYNARITTLRSLQVTVYKNSTITVTNAPNAIQVKPLVHFSFGPRDPEQDICTKNVLRFTQP